MTSFRFIICCLANSVQIQENNTLTENKRWMQNKERSGGDSIFLIQYQRISFHVFRRMLILITVFQ